MIPLFFDKKENLRYNIIKAKERIIIMTSTELGVEFLKHYPVDENGFSSAALIDDLVKISPDYRTANGCSWARSDGSYLGKRFFIERVKKDGRTYSVQLCGYRTAANHSIPENVKKELKGYPCVLLGTTTNTEIDHKDATYTTEILTTSDFQVLHKSVNDAKRQHCKVCRATNIRFDARRLAFPAPYICGSENLQESGCKGCFWYDISAFIKEMTKNYDSSL